MDPSDDPMLDDKAFEEALCPQCQNHAGMSYSELKQLALEAQTEIQRLHAQNTALKQTVQRLEFAAPAPAPAHIAQGIDEKMTPVHAIHSEAQLRATVAVLKEENGMLLKNVEHLKALKGVQDPNLVKKADKEIVRLKMTVKELMRQLEQSKH